MKRQKITHLMFLILALTLLILANWPAMWLGDAPPQPRFALANTETHTIHWSTIDSGGGSSSGSGYTLSGTIGQHDAGPPQGMSSATYTLHGGYWPSATPAYHHYLPVIH